MRPLDERAQPDIQVRTAAAVQFDLPGSKDLPHVADRGIAARDDDVCAVPSWRVRPASSARARANCESFMELEVSIRNPGCGRGCWKLGMRNSP